MIVIALLGLAAMWVAVLVPEWWRDRGHRGTRKGSSIDAFHRQLDILGRAAPRSVEPAHRLERRRAWQPAPVGSTSGVSVPPGGVGLPPAGLLSMNGGVSMRGVPRSEAEASQRRRIVLVALVGLAALTFVLWLATGAAVMLVAHAAVDLMTGGFAWLVLRHRQLRADRLAKVRYLRASPSGRSLEPVLVRSVR